MADQYRCCATCPKRDTARLLRAWGDEAGAVEVLEAGCPDWWGADRGFRGEATAAHPGGEPLEGCGRELLPELLRALTQQEKGHAAASESHRNEVDRERREVLGLVGRMLEPLLSDRDILALNATPPGSALGPANSRADPSG